MAKAKKSDNGARAFMVGEFDVEEITTNLR
jgi:hypothetical protein